MGKKNPAKMVCLYFSDIFFQRYDTVGNTITKLKDDVTVIIYFTTRSSL